jgi:hypothetical protein
MTRPILKSAVRAKPQKARGRLDSHDQPASGTVRRLIGVLIFGEGYGVVVDTVHDDALQLGDGASRMLTWSTTVLAPRRCADATVPKAPHPRPRTKDQLVALSALAVRVRARPGRISPHIRELFEHVAPTRKTGNASHKTL